MYKFHLELNQDIDLKKKKGLGTFNMLSCSVAFGGSVAERVPPSQRTKWKGPDWQVSDDISSLCLMLLMSVLNPFIETFKKTENATFYERGGKPMLLITVWLPVYFLPHTLIAECRPHSCFKASLIMLTAAKPSITLSLGLRFSFQMSYFTGFEIMLL